VPSLVFTSQMRGARPAGSADDTSDSQGGVSTIATVEAIHTLDKREIRRAPRG